MKKTVILSILLCSLTYCLYAQNTQKISLGDGYQNAKWGMTKDQVLNSLSNDRIILEDSTESSNLRFKIDGIKKLTCLFYNHRFYKAIYEPNYNDDDVKGVQAVLLSLQKKYGSGKHLLGYRDSFMGIDLLLIVWDDGISNIKFRMWDPKVASSKLGNYPSSTLTVVYTCKKTQLEIEKREKFEKLNKEREENNKKIKNVENDI
jgi:hypothetical protein